MIPALIPAPGGPRAVRCTAPGCHRWLTDPGSILRGQGAVCWGKTHPATPRRRAVMAAVPPRHPDPVDGQLVLDITTTTEG